MDSDGMGRGLLGKRRRSGEHASLGAGKRTCCVGDAVEHDGDAPFSQLDPLAPRAKNRTRPKKCSVREKRSSLSVGTSDSSTGNEGNTEVVEKEDAWEAISVRHLRALFAREWTESQSEFERMRDLAPKSLSAWLHGGRAIRCETQVREYFRITSPDGPPPVSQLDRLPPPAKHSGKTKHAKHEDSLSDSTAPVQNSSAHEGSGVSGGGGAWDGISVGHLRALFARKCTMSQRRFAKMTGLTQSSLSFWLRGFRRSPACERAAREYLCAIMPHGPPPVSQLDDDLSDDGGEECDAWEAVSVRHLRALFVHEWTESQSEFTNPRGLASGAFSLWLHGNHSVPSESAVREYFRAVMPDGPPPVSQLDALPPPAKNPGSTKDTSEQEQSSMPCGPLHHSTAHEGKTEAEEGDAWDDISVWHLRALFARESVHTQSQVVETKGLEAGAFSGWLRGEYVSPLCEGAVREYFRASSETGPPLFGAARCIPVPNFSCF